ncbi:MAG TPA: lipid-A-disaccharide synthase [Alphaproteobacteria bacterium]|mgnify:CR=1 FL=1|nr:lipid-A-disaccharide synthase [Alphaproteobacteria bacterium]
MKIFIVAGETSGDQLGAKLLSDLRALHPDIEVRGIGGMALAQQGMQSLFSMSDLSLMGIAEVLPKIPQLIKRLDKTAAAIAEFAPDIVLTIDVPDFSKRLAKKLQPLRGKIKLVHYVAPTVWAWRAGRAKTMAKLFDHLFCLFPFEPPYFEREGLAATFVGHPIAMQEEKGDAAHLRAKLAIRDDQQVICFLPGSRRSEVKKLLPIFLETLQRLQQQNPDIVALLPTMPHLQDEVLAQTNSIANLHVLPPQDKQDAFALAAEQGGAIAASGTVTLELAAVGCPHVIAYVLHPLTEMMVRMLYKLPHVNLVNILAGRTIVCEYLQGAVTADALVTAYKDCREKSAHQKVEFIEQLNKLKASAPNIAAQTLLRLLNRA